MHNLVSHFTLHLLVLLVCVLGNHSIAADKPEKANGANTNSVTGKWTYTLEVSLDTALDFTAELKQDGEKVTGFILVQEVKTEIEKGKLKDGQLTFEIPREYGGVKFTSRYTGKVVGDKITGKIVSGTAPVERTYEWNAKRAKPDAKP
ncbi:MAG: hypothetical protein FJ392_05935 [Verrucomicrobia bacterium]|nr:hypothetical protein [Verrucomicrobiota bacterium]